MNYITTIAVWGFGIILSCFIVFQGYSPHIFSKQPDIVAQLGPRLSTNASIFLPGSEDFKKATTRWQRYREPEIDVVVEVADERDVQQTILYANERHIPYLAKVGGHGATNSLGDLHNGIQISMRWLNYVCISEGDVSTIGGGVKVKEVIDALWSAGKQTVTGACECVGMLGPMLGGGHGFLQGQHGLLADQLVEARIVLANRTALTISQDSNPDLFWAIRGAGHNFGIVTEFKYKIYDVVPNKTWAYEAFTFTGDKLEALYSLTNEMMKTQLPEVVNYAIVFRLPAVDAVNPVILYYILYDGPASDELQYSTPIHALGPVDVQAGEAASPQLPELTGNGNEGLACQPGAVALRFPIDLKTYDVPALRLVYNAFGDMMQRVPAFNSSFFLLEGYSVQAVQAVPAQNTAFPHRSDTLLLSPVIYYQPNASLDSSAIEFGQTARNILRSASGGSQQHSYVN